MFYKNCRTAEYISVHYGRFEKKLFLPFCGTISKFTVTKVFLGDILNKYIMFSNSKIIVISTLTKIIVVMIFSIIEQR